MESRFWVGITVWHTDIEKKKKLASSLLNKGVKRLMCHNYCIYYATRGVTESLIVMQININLNQSIYWELYRRLELYSI